ncbi:MAG TPA: tyrosine-type recombinase/integrase [Ginsengibacter sp.]|nr:tyrosine-type recombinase/integrase [Ginsengibacter sp.]
MFVQDKNRLPIIPLFKKFIADSSSGRRVTPSGKRICKGAVLQYKYVLKLLEQFQCLQSFPFRIQLLNRSSQRILQSEKLYWKRFFKNFLQWLYQKNYFDLYVGSVAKILRTFFNYLLKDQCLIIGNFHQQFKVPPQNLTPIVLEPQQLKFLITNEAFKNSLSQTLKRTNDIFVFGCTVGLRYSDLMRLKKSDLQFTDHGAFVILNTSKTAAQVKIPLPQYVLEIINKYKSKTGKYVLPRLANSNLNLQLKSLMQTAGWVYNLPKVRYRQGKPVELKNKQGNTYRFCDHITAHTMRRTAITTLLLMGVEENIVRTISGHSPGSKEFYKYVAVVQNYLNKQVITAYDKLINLP